MDGRSSRPARRGERQVVIEFGSLGHNIDRDFRQNMSHRVNARGRLLRAPSLSDVRGDGPGLP